MGFIFPHFKIFPRLVLVILLFFCVLSPETALARVWNLSHEEPFRDGIYKGEVTEDGFQFTILEEQNSFLYHYKLSEDFLIAQRSSVTTNVKTLENAVVGVGIGNKNEGLVMEINQAGVVFLSYCEFRGESIRYWAIKEAHTLAPSFPLLLKIVYEPLPSFVKGYANGKEVIAMSLEGNSICSPPRRLSHCWIKTASPKGTKKAKATFSFVEAKLE